MNICSICGAPYAGAGNNADPVTDGRCCNECNGNVVIPARLRGHTKISQPNLDILTRMKELRCGRGWSQQIMAELLGVSLTRYQKWEQRGRIPPEFLPKFAELVNRTIEFILTGSRCGEPDTRLDSVCAWHACAETVAAGPMPEGWTCLVAFRETKAPGHLDFLTDATTRDTVLCPVHHLVFEELLKRIR